MIPLFDDNPHRRPPVVTVALILACAAVLLVEVMLPSEKALERFVRTWGLVPAALWQAASPRVWATVGTSMFLHGGWLHLIGNCWFLWIFGNNIEDRLGHVGFVLFYLVSGLAATALQVVFDPFTTMPMIGASGAISGVLGAYMRFYPKAPVYTFTGLWFLPIVPVPAFVFILVWFALQFWQGVGAVFSSSVEGGVAWWAHIGGFIAGLAMAGAMNARRQRRRSRR
jgi:membrane associated rhomboid family serine protease